MTHELAQVGAPQKHTLGVTPGTVGVRGFLWQSWTAWRSQNVNHEKPKRRRRRGTPNDTRRRHVSPNHLQGRREPLRADSSCTTQCGTPSRCVFGLGGRAPKSERCAGGRIGRTVERSPCRARRHTACKACFSPNPAAANVRRTPVTSSRGIPAPVKKAAHDDDDAPEDDDNEDDQDDTNDKETPKRPSRTR
jgi:hypothetical protein